MNYIITGDETWIYYYDVPTKSHRKIWVFEGEEHPTQARKIQKENDGGFLWKTWYHQDGDAGTSKDRYSEMYTETCLPQLMETLSNLRPRSRMDFWILHHDNAPAHRAHATIDYLKKVGMKVLSHPP